MHAVSKLNFRKRTRGQEMNRGRTTIVVGYFCLVFLLAPAGGGIRSDDPTASKRRVEPGSDDLNVPTETYEAWARPHSLFVCHHSIAHHSSQAKSENMMDVLSSGRALMPCCSG